MNPLQQTKILLVDDHRIFNDGLKRLIDEQADFQVCAQVYHARELFYTMERHRPDLVLMDINLQGANGIDLGKKLIFTYPTVKILILTMYNQPKLLEETRRAGLHGYLLKDAATPELLGAIRNVISGNTSFDSLITNFTKTQGTGFEDDFEQVTDLTFREIEIIGLVRKGLTNEQIAENLNLSFFTVKTHRKNIHFKLGINNVAELVQFATKYNL